MMVIVERKRVTKDIPVDEEVDLHVKKILEVLEAESKKPVGYIESNF
jgi:hypothetical protein